jgi:hypothetical protein
MRPRRRGGFYDQGKAMWKVPFFVFMIAITVGKPGISFAPPNYEKCECGDAPKSLPQLSSSQHEALRVAKELDDIQSRLNILEKNAKKIAGEICSSAAHHELEPLVCDEDLKNKIKLQLKKSPGISDLLGNKSELSRIISYKLDNSDLHFPHNFDYTAFPTLKSLHDIQNRKENAPQRFRDWQCEPISILKDGKSHNAVACTKLGTGSF